MRKLAIVAVLGLAVLTAAAGFFFCPKARATVPIKVVEAYKIWTSKYGKLRSTPQEADYRLRVFHKNYELVEKHNQAKQTWTMALNQFADQTEEEFKSMLTQTPLQTVEGATIYQPEAEQKSLAQTPNFDYRNWLPFPYISGSSTCNDNYAWISAFNMNSNYYMDKQSPIAYKFSPQTYIDCSGNFGNSGCNGGWAANSFKYSNQWGIDTLDDYPYTGYQKACRATMGYFKNSGMTQTPFGSNTALYSALAGRKMISVGIDITGARFYNGGVFEGPCSDQPNQNMLLLGAGADPQNGKFYWLLLNTWGQFWGEGGFMRLIRYTNDGPTQTSCGITKQAFFPTF